MLVLRVGSGRVAGLLVALALTGCQAAGPRTVRNGGGSHTLCKCTMLIPIGASDTMAEPPAWLGEFTDRLYDRFGGFTIAGVVEGACRMADGSRSVDRCVAIWVALDADRVDELRREVAAIGSRLHQESVYFEVGGAAVELVGSQP